MTIALVSIGATVIVIMDYLMWMRMLRVLRSLSLTPDGTAFTGRCSRWQVQTFTGRVASENRYTSVSSTSGYSSTSGSSTKTTVHQELMLVDGTGRRHKATLSDMGARIFTGQVVTHCWATSGHERVTFAALNHSTRQQQVSEDGLGRIIWGSDALMLPWAAVSWMSFIGIPQVIVFIIFYYRRISAFKRSGVDALWAATAPAPAPVPGQDLGRDLPAHRPDRARPAQDRRRPRGAHRRARSSPGT